MTKKFARAIAIVIFLITPLTFRGRNESFNLGNLFNNVVSTTAFISPSASPAATKSPVNLVEVVRIVDGDTIEIEGGKRVRLIGIDAPEVKSNDCYEKEATNYLTSLLDNQSVELEKDVSEIDRYGRLLRYIYKDGVMVNELLVQEGYAKSSTYPPDIKYQDQFREAERVAREQKKGLWGSCETK